MKKIIIAGFSFVGLFLTFTVGVLFWIMSITNTKVALKEQYNASQKTMQTAHDNMWKTISQKYQLASEYKDGFIKSVDAVVEGRKGGNLFKSVQENMPGLSPEIYKDVMATIEGKRDMLKREIDQSVDIARQYNTFVQSAPQCWFIDNTKIEPHIITSSDTNAAYETGEDNSVKLGK